MVAVVVSVVGISLALQMVDGLLFPDSLIVALLVVNLALHLLALRKRANSEDTPPGA